MDRRTWMDGQKDAWMGGRLDTQKGRQTDGRTGRWTAQPAGRGSSGDTGASRTDRRTVPDGSPWSHQNPPWRRGCPRAPIPGGARPRCGPSLGTGTPGSRSTHGTGTPPGVPPAARPHPWVPPGTLLAPGTGTALGQSPPGTRASTQSTVRTRAADQSEPAPPSAPPTPPYISRVLPGVLQVPLGAAGGWTGTRGGGGRLGWALIHTTSLFPGGGPRGPPAAPHLPWGHTERWGN